MGIKNYQIKMLFKRHSSRIIIAAAALCLLATACKHDKAPELNDANDSIAWILGRNTAESFASGPFKDIDKEIFIEAVRTTLDGGAQPISDSVYQQAIEMLMHAAQSRAMQQSADRSKEVDRLQDEYFANLVANNPNVKKHPSGFYYEQLKAGKGPNAHFASLISFDYRSYTMFDGKPFDQTYGVRDAISHVVGKPMFPGLIEAFQLMNEGSIYRFYFPYHLAFGASGSDGIPGYTPLIYELELHSIAKFK